ncbi:MAG: lysozyme [Patescibacteria group bacterium]|nr:lysozyme [Patescibacteria group bacterium]
MQLGPRGIALIKGFEKCRLVAYPDQRGVPTIGYGHTQGVKEGDTCTQAQADQWFLEDTHAAVVAVIRDLAVPVTQNQFDALVSFFFNVGVTAAGHSTLLRLVNLGQTSLAGLEFLSWDHCDGVVDPGLTRRREAERALFLEKSCPTVQ